MGGIGHSVLVGDAHLARTDSIGSHSDKLIQDLPCLLAGASGFSFDIHSSNNVFVMSNTIIKVSEIVSVRHYNTGWTDYLTVALSSGASYKWSCYHYEESASQREKCDDMRMAFGRIKNAIANKMEFVDFYISD